MATRKKVPQWEDGTPKSLNNAFNWRNNAESLMAQDKGVKASTTLAQNRASGKVAVNTPKTRITLNTKFKK